MSKDRPLSPETMDWKRLEEQVVARIRALAEVAGDKLDAPPELRAKIWNDLILPNVHLLGAFCMSVTLEDEGDARGGE